MGMMPQMGQQPQGQPPQQGQPQGGQPANVAPEALMALLSFLQRLGPNLQQGQSAPQGGSEVGQGSLQQLMPMLLHLLSQNPQQAQQQQGQQQQAQQAQEPPQILQMLSKMGLTVK
jgi:hypothetical protein